MKCSACLSVEVHPWADPCLPCVARRHRAAVTNRCSCPKRIKRPREITLCNRIETRCDCCLGLISTKDKPDGNLNPD